VRRREDGAAGAPAVAGLDKAHNAFPMDTSDPVVNGAPHQRAVAPSPRRSAIHPS